MPGNTLIYTLKLVRGNDNVAIALVGDGPTLNEMKMRAATLGIERQTVFHGYVSQEEVVRILASADLFALPTEYEGLPKAMVEAMAAGVPVLVSDVAPLNALIENGRNGYLVPNCPRKWAEAMASLSKDRDSLAKTAALAKKEVLQDYDCRKNILRYKEEFERLARCSV